MTEHDNADPHHEHQIVDVRPWVRGTQGIIIPITGVLAIIGATVSVVLFYQHILSVEADLRLEMADIRKEVARLIADVGALSQWKGRLIEEGWLPPSLEARLRGLEASQAQLLVEIQGLRRDLMSVRSSRSGSPAPSYTYRIPESASPVED